MGGGGILGGVEVPELPRPSSFEDVARAKTARDPRLISNDLQHPELGQSSNSLGIAPSTDVSIPKGGPSLLSRGYTGSNHSSANPAADTKGTSAGSTSQPAPVNDDNNNGGSSLTEQEASVLCQTYSEAHKYHPRFWPLYKRCLITFFYSMTAVLVNISITAWVSSIPTIQKKFGGSEQHVLLGQSLFIVGTALGPYLLAPIS